MVTYFIADIFKCLLKMTFESVIESVSPSMLQKGTTGMLQYWAGEEYLKKRLPEVSIAYYIRKA